MAIKKVTVYEGQQLNESQLEELKRLEMMTEEDINTEDEDCPILSTEECEMVAAMARTRRAARKKKNISLRIPEAMLEQAKKSIGKGYTGFFSRLLEEAYRHPELVKKCL